MSATLLILGASARAAAASARRAGFDPLAADMFGDVDLAVCSQWLRVDSYPAGLALAAENLPQAPWLYTGGLENHPYLVDRISADRTLYGNPGSVLRQVRDPWQVARVLAEFTLPCLAVAASPAECLEGVWVRKPRRSCGGGGIVRLDTRSPPDAELVQPNWLGGNYYQRFAVGQPCSAVFLAARGRAVLLGATYQLTGTSWTGAAAFQYAGSLGPLFLNEAATHAFQALGNCLAERFSLVGLVGVDAVWDGQTVWLVEVNPRYPASAEILERAFDIQVLEGHVRACVQGELAAAAPAACEVYHGKAVVYARRDVVIPEGILAWTESARSAAPWPTLADIPAPGTVIRQCQPVLTVFAAGDSLPQVERQLRERVAQVQSQLQC